jgi:hypothetical protein
MSGFDPKRIFPKLFVVAMFFLPVFTIYFRLTGEDSEIGHSPFQKQGWRILPLTRTI